MEKGLTAEEIYSILKRQIGSSTVTPEQIQQSVEDYLNKHPVLESLKTISGGTFENWEV